MELQTPKAVNPVDENPVLGDLVLCGNCGEPNVITLTEPRALTEAEFDSLSADEKSDLSFAQRAIRKN